LAEGGRHPKDEEPAGTKFINQSVGLAGGKAKSHGLQENQCAMGHAAKLRRIFGIGKTYFTEQL